MIKYHLTKKAIETGCKFEAPRDGDAGYDLYVNEICIPDLKAPDPIRDGRWFDIRGCKQWDGKFYIRPGEQVLVATGLHVEIPSGYVGLVKGKSGLALTKLYKHAGVIDSSYRGEILVLIANQGVESQSQKVMFGKKFRKSIFNK